LQSGPDGFSRQERSGQPGDRHGLALGELLDTATPELDAFAKPVGGNVARVSARERPLSLAPGDRRRDVPLAWPAATACIAHFSVLPAISVRNSAGELGGSAIAPRSTRRAFANQGRSS